MINFIVFLNSILLYIFKVLIRDFMGLKNLFSGDLDERILIFLYQQLAKNLML